MAWLVLVLAGVCEIGWAVGLKYSNGLSRPIPTLLTALALAMSMTLLAWSVKTLPLGTAYAVWTGIGAVGAVTLGVILFGEPVSLPRLLCVALIVMGILGLRLYADGHA